MEEERHVGDRDAEELESRILVVDRLLRRVVDDARRLDLPERRALRMLEAGLAGGVDTAAEDRQVAVAPLRGLRGEARLVDRHDIEAADEAVAEVVGDVEAFGGDDVAVRLQHAHAAGGDQPARFLIVDDLFGVERVAIVVDLHIADRGDGLAVEIVDELVGLQQQLLVRDPRHRRLVRRRNPARAPHTD